MRKNHGAAKVWGPREVTTEDIHFWGESEVGRCTSGLDVYEDWYSSGQFKLSKRNDGNDRVLSGKII